MGGNMSNYDTLPDWLKRLLRPKGDGKPVCLLGEDGAIVAGEVLTLADYRRRYDGRARHEVKVSGLQVARYGR